MTPITIRTEIEPRGRFSLAAAAGFGFGPNEGRPPPFDGVMRLAFGVDGGTGYAGVVLAQSGDEPDGPVELEIETSGGGDPAAAAAQAARIVSLDHDGAAFARVGERDAAIGRLQAAHPGQRPVLFHSPYEAAAWSIISARRPARTAAAVRAAIAERLGTPFELAGRTLHAFPQPDRLAELADDTPGLGSQKAQRLRALARVAVSGELDAARLLALGAEQAHELVMRIDGIGPFYATLIVLRGTGFADALLPAPEPKVLGHAARLYGRSEPMTLEQLSELAESWRPFRTWTTVLIRLAGARGTF